MRKAAGMYQLYCQETHEEAGKREPRGLRREVLLDRGGRPGRRLPDRGGGDRYRLPPGVPADDLGTVRAVHLGAVRPAVLGCGLGRHPPARQAAQAGAERPRGGAGEERRGVRRPV